MLKAFKESHCNEADDLQLMTVADFLRPYNVFDEPFFFNISLHESLI